MSLPEIAPLAKKMAIENNVPWQKLKGTGDNGIIQEKDVLEYLTRVMTGEEDLDPTPEPTPDGMEAWPEEDVADYMGSNASEAALDDAANSVADDLDSFDAFADDSADDAFADDAFAGDAFADDAFAGGDDAFSDDLFAVDEDDDPFGATSSETPTDAFSDSNADDDDLFSADAFGDVDGADDAVQQATAPANVGEGGSSGDGGIEGLDGTDLDGMDDDLFAADGLGEDPFGDADNAFATDAFADDAFGTEGMVDVAAETDDAAEFSDDLFALGEDDVGEDNSSDDLSMDDDLFAMDAMDDTEAEDMAGFTADSPPPSTDFAQDATDADAGMEATDDLFGSELDAPSSATLDRDVFGTDPFGNQPVDPAVFEMDTDISTLDAGMGAGGAEDDDPFGDTAFANDTLGDNDTFGDDAFGGGNIAEESSSSSAQAANSTDGTDTMFMDAPNDYSAVAGATFAGNAQFSEPAMPPDDDDAFLDFEDFGTESAEGMEDVEELGTELDGADMNADQALDGDPFGSADAFAEDDMFTDDAFGEGALEDSTSLEEDALDDMAFDDGAFNDDAFADGQMAADDIDSMDDVAMAMSSVDSRDDESDANGAAVVSNATSPEDSEIMTSTAQDDALEDLESLSEDDFADIDLDSDLGDDFGDDVGSDQSDSALKNDDSSSSGASVTAINTDHTKANHTENESTTSSSSARHEEVPTDGIPRVQHGVIVRKYIDMMPVVAALQALQEDVSEEDSLNHVAFLVRAAARMLQQSSTSITTTAMQSSEAETPLNTLVLARVSEQDGLTFHALKAKGELASQPFATFLQNLNPSNLTGMAQSDISKDSLVIVDMSAYAIDEAVLHVGAPVLMLGQGKPTHQPTHRADSSGQNTAKLEATLTLSGDVQIGQAATFLAQVAPLLETPIRLVF